ncbi:RxLR effector protein [Phytophthora megakarya]|uniref:RxLR effector protein n=1 Tax=Phytophthora megakarya TaxID=4795 RepID=A0A225WUS0_9STRA|nr:RxLR effector protein [Phytophthora megakarya]
MGLAAKDGYLDVMQWLHDNRKECCTAVAWIDAAANGTLAALLAYIGCFSAATASTIGQQYTENYQGAVHNRVLRTYGSIKSNAEERMNAARKIKWHLSKLGKNAEADLKSPNLVKYWKYVDQFNKKIPLKQLTVTGSLMEKYGDDAVLKAIVSAKQVENTKEVATKLEMNYSNAQSVDDVFNSLKLREEGEKILVGHKFKLLENYLVYSNRMQHRDESLRNVLTKGFGGEDELVLALSSARINEHAQNKLKELVTPIFLRKIDDQMKNFQMNNGVESILRSQE